MPTAVCLGMAAPRGDRTDMHRDLAYDGPIDDEAFDRVLRIIRRATRRRRLLGRVLPGVRPPRRIRRVDRLCQPWRHRLDACRTGPVLAGLNHRRADVRGRRESSEWI